MTKCTISLSLILAVGVSHGDVISSWDMNANLLSSPTSVNANRHIGGATTSGAYAGWEERRTQGALINTASPAAAGSLRFGFAGNTSPQNGFYGGVNFGNGSLDLANDPYVYAAPGPEVTLRMNINHIDFSATTGTGGNNANFGFRLWDIKSGDTDGVTGGYWIGLAVQDSFNADRLMLTVQGSPGVILSGGTLNTPKTRSRVDWLTANNDLVDDTDYQFELALNLDTGAWGATINGGTAVTGTFDNTKITAIDRYQAAFQQFSDGDHVDIDLLEVESVVPEPVSVGLVFLGGSFMLISKRILSR